MPIETPDVFLTPMEWVFLGGALLVTLPMLWALRYFIRELKKEESK